MGTVTVNDVTDAAETVALTAPKKTMFLSAVVLKFVPVIFTIVPIGPEAGAKAVILGCAKRERLNSSTVISNVNLFISRSLTFKI